MMTRRDGGKEDRGRKDSGQAGGQRGSWWNRRGGKKSSEGMDNNRGQEGWRARRWSKSEFEE